MESTPRRSDIGVSSQQPVRENRALEPRDGTPGADERERPGTLLITRERVTVSIKDEDSGNGDLSLDVAAAVGRTLAKMVDRIETLEKGRAELIQKLGGFRSVLDGHFRKWLPPSRSGTGREHRQ